MQASRGRILGYSVAVVTCVLGIASLSLFGYFLWHGSFGLVEPQFRERSILSWDAALCLLFFVQHSGMVRKSFQARTSRVLPEHWQPVVYTIASSVALLVLVGCWLPAGTTIYVAEGAGLWLIRAVLLLCFAGVLWGLRSLGEWDAFGVQGYLARNRGDVEQPAKLSVKGPYRLIRHPFYSFGIVALWAAPTLSLDRLLLNVLFTAWIVLGATLEERDLLAKFGESYVLYQRTVPMFAPHPGGWRRRVAPRHS